MLHQSYWEKVKLNFNKDISRAWVWFESPNSELNGASPIDLINLKKIKKLEDYIDTMVGSKKR